MTDLQIKKGLELSSNINANNNINNNSIESANSLKKSGKGIEANRNEVWPVPTLLGLAGVKILSKK